MEANDLALMQVGLSFQKLLIEVPETWHGAEILVLLRTDDLKERFRSRKDRIKELLTKVQYNVSIKEPFQPEIAVLAILFPQLFYWEPCPVGFSQPVSLVSYPVHSHC